MAVLRITIILLAGYICTNVQSVLLEVCFDRCKLNEVINPTICRFVCESMTEYSLITWKNHGNMTILNGRTGNKGAMEYLITIHNEWPENWASKNITLRELCMEDCVEWVEWDLPCSIHCRRPIGHGFVTILHTHRRIDWIVHKHHQYFYEKWMTFGDTGPKTTSTNTTGNP